MDLNKVQYSTDDKEMEQNKENLSFSSNMAHANASTQQFGG